MAKASKTKAQTSSKTPAHDPKGPASMRKPARRMKDIPREVLTKINQGQESTLTLVEILAADFSTLLASVCPKTSKAFPDLFIGEDGAPMGVVDRMKAAGHALHESHGRKGIVTFASHQSDIVRGWASYMIGCIPDLEIQEYLRHIRPLADDPHSGVREWAWMAIRPHIAQQLLPAILSLEPWTRESSPNLRRFAVESTRPRGVWCEHIPALREDPEIALTLLENVNQDPIKYVQDSCANWLNDASKSRPDWVRKLCASWSTSPNSATQRICTRALRTLHKAQPAKTSPKTAGKNNATKSPGVTGRSKPVAKSRGSSSSLTLNLASAVRKPVAKSQTGGKAARK